MSHAVSLAFEINEQLPIDGVIEFERQLHDVYGVITKITSIKAEGGKTWTSITFAVAPLPHLSLIDRLSRVVGYWTAQFATLLRDVGARPLTTATLTAVSVTALADLPAQDQREFPFVSVTI